MNKMMSSMTNRNLLKLKCLDLFSGSSYDIYEIKETKEIVDHHLFHIHPKKKLKWRKKKTNVRRRGHGSLVFFFYETKEGL